MTLRSILAASLLLLPLLATAHNFVDGQRVAGDRVGDLRAIDELLQVHLLPPGFEDDDRDLPVRPRLVVVEVGVQVDEAGPEQRPFGGVGHPGVHRPATHQSETRPSSAVQVSHSAYFGWKRNQPEPMNLLPTEMRRVSGMVSTPALIDCHLAIWLKTSSPARPRKSQYISSTSARPPARA